MAPVLLYLLKVNLVISILFLGYYCLLRSEKFFRLNRIVLLSAIGLALVLPLLPAMESTAEGGLGRGLWDYSPFIHWTDAASNAPAAAVSPHVPFSEQPSGHSTTSVLPVFTILEWLYFMVTTVLLLRLVFQLLQVRSIISSSRREKLNGIIYCYHDKNVPVFSFFHCLVINKGQYPPAEVEPIIAHEQAHIRQGHSVDILLVEVLHALVWINPLLIGFKRTVKLNLEFIADKAVLDTGVDAPSYQYSILRCLRPSGLPLVNLFASSKIKIRIHMMNKENSPIRNLYKYALALPLLAGCYFIVNPLKARSMPITASKEVRSASRQDLKVFEGYYQKDDSKDTYIQIRAAGDQLILKQLWDDREIAFHQTSLLEFVDEAGKFPLKFFKNSQGVVVQVLAFNRDHWNKMKSYHPPVPIHLLPEELKRFEGYYQMAGHDGNMSYIQIESIPDALILRQGWDGREVLFNPRSATEFFAQGGAFPLEFTKDGNGNVTQVLAFHHDLWKKMQDPSTAVIKKQVRLEPGQLKALQGEYQMQEGGNKISITAEGEGIVVKQGWDNAELHLVPSSPTEFFSKERGALVAFKVDNNGEATELIAFGRDHWKKIK